MQITKKMFEDASSQDEISINDNSLNSWDTLGVFKCNYNGYSCYLIHNTIFDFFSEEDIIVQTIAYLGNNADSSLTVKQLKSRKKINIVCGGEVWTRWLTEDAEMYNYINSCIDNGSQIKIRKWSRS